MKEIILVLFNRALGRILKLGRARFKSTFQAGICFGISLGLSLSASTAFSPARAGETINYNGNVSLLDVDVFNSTQSLFPKNSLSNNSVTVSGGTVTHNVFGGMTSGDATVSNNSVHISDGYVGLDVYGGYSDLGNATHNSITISGGQVGLDVYGGRSSLGNATHNSITISGGQVYGGVYGGYSSLGNATHNSIIISGGTVYGRIIGGWSSSGDTTYNSVTISGKPILTESVLIGGYDADFAGPPNDMFTGNTLNLWGFQGKIKGLQSFQHFNFSLPANIKNGETVLTATGSVILLDIASTSRNSVVNVGIMGGGRVQQAGEKFRLIDASTFMFGLGLNTKAQGLKGISLLYDFDITTAGALAATVKGAPKLNPQTKSLTEARAAGVAFANQAGDMAAGQGILSALNAASQVQAAPAGGLYPADGPRIAAFASSSASTSRYNTGSHIDVDGVSLIAGLAARNPVGVGDLLLGAFFESGWGSFDSHNSFSSRPDVNADGDSNYYGGGLLARYDFPCGFYTDASARLGRLKTEFSSDDLQNFMGQGSSYDSSVMYYGAHAGLGYIWALSEAANLDLYSKYLWTHQDSDSVTISGDHFKFDSINSHRVRGGTRFSYSFDGIATPYMGAAYEHEFDGEANASVYGYSLNAPSLEGGTGIGEVGITLTPPDSGFSFDVGMQGYVGMREGVSGNVQLKYEF